MKLIILTLLFSLNSYAQFKVEIINHESQSMSKDCETEIECNEYIARVKHKWGREDGWYKKPCADALETREVGEDFDKHTEYHCPKNYSADVVVDTEGNERKAKKITDDARKSELKAKKMKLDELIELLELKGVI